MKIELEFWQILYCKVLSVTYGVLKDNEWQRSPALGAFPRISPPTQIQSYSYSHYMQTPTHPPHYKLLPLQTPLHSEFLSRAPFPPPQWWHHFNDSLPICDVYACICALLQCASVHSVYNMQYIALCVQYAICTVYAICMHWLAKLFHEAKAGFPSKPWLTSAREWIIKFQWKTFWHQICVGEWVFLSTVTK